jgi:hypothetical protein
VRQIGHRARPFRLQQAPPKLHDTPYAEVCQRWESKPGKRDHPNTETAHEPGVRKSQGVERDDARNTTAGANQRDVVTGVEADVEGVANDSTAQDKNEVAETSKAILDVISEDVQEVQVAEQMKDVGMEKK